MNRTILYSLSAVTAISVMAAASRNAISAGQTGALVRLQSTSPGSQQVGHANVSGTLRAGQFVGGGAGVTGVNADLLDGINSTAFLQSVPNPLSLSGSAGSPIITATNSNGATGAAGVKGVATAAAGVTYGLWGTNSSASGRAVFGEATSTTGLNYGGRFESASNSGRAVYGLASASTGNAYGVFGESQSSSGRAVLGLANATSGVNYGGYFDSDSVSGYGVYANSAGEYGVFGQSTLTSGTAYGVFGTSAAFNGYGIYGEATSTTGLNYGGRFRNVSTSGGAITAAALSSTGSTYGGRFENNSTAGRGVFGWALATSGTTYGVWGRSDSPTGRGVFGESSTGTGGYFTSTSGQALRAESDGDVAATIISTNPGTVSTYPVGLLVQSNYQAGQFDGTYYGVRGSGSEYGLQGTGNGETESVGVRGSSASVDGRGVEGAGETGVAGFSSVFRGVWGDAFDNSGGSAYGVHGEARSNPGRGVYGLASNTFSGTGYGVRGVNQSPAGYGVYSAGDFGASGTKAFVIDHPFDPANKYLKHFCAEGPEPKNIYDGEITTDAKGWATVELPDYFTTINKNPKIQLTVEDSSEDFVMVKSVGGIKDGTFRLRTSKGGVKVYWEVKAVRNDAWVKAHPPVVEVEKDPHERGKYQHPELYGQPKEMGVDYDVRLERAKNGRALSNGARRTKK